MNAMWTEEMPEGTPKNRLTYIDRNDNNLRSLRETFIAGTALCSLGGVLGGIIAFWSAAEHGLSWHIGTGLWLIVVGACGALFSSRQVKKMTAELEWRTVQSFDESSDENVPVKIAAMVAERGNSITL